MKSPTQQAFPFDEEIKQQIHHYYEDAKRLLLAGKSYKRTVNVKQVESFLLFVEYALQRPANRLMHLGNYLRDEEGLMVGKMCPFAFLLPKIAKRIDTLATQAVKLSECYALLYPERENLLFLEPHEVE